ncbi:lytic murein transglycosylase B [Methylomagnum ishizawai]|uniref:lytic murein transglycosylase B n=1 Tax=Methylomagnum ishizawai TaxID=1760988 RepID=UPI001C32AB53|nr:lytic murein transglycosylase B [Methylomagnum ishizawai]BBL76562.1 murein transglycosylase B [Methylomagnum ishizawai]
MNAPSFVHALTLVSGLLCLGGCASNPPAPVHRTPEPYSHAPDPAPAEPQTESEYPTPVGAYHARYLTGDYAGYPALENFIERMAARHGYGREYLYGLFSQARRKQWTLDYLSHESKPGAKPKPGSWTRYRGQFLDEKHISTGAAFWAKYAGALRRASAQYGVSPEHIMGIMGVETIYGGNIGNHRIIDALTTLAFDYPRRGDYFAEELENFLLMTRQEGMDPSRPVGSYAGAMGLGQFMPSSFLRYAVDFDGDGRRDLWDPEDAIGSIANYFAGHGWKAGEPVTAPASVAGPGAEGLECGFDKVYPLSTLESYGIRPSLDYPVEKARLLRLKAVDGDEYWLGYDNFYVITRYNHSTNYAMAVHQLAQAVKQRYSKLASR